MSTHFRLLNATLKGWHLAKSVLCQVNLAKNLLKLRTIAPKNINYYNYIKKGIHMNPLTSNDMVSIECWIR